jgi:hypothetical protein
MKKCIIDPNFMNWYIKVSAFGLSYILFDIVTALFFLGELSFLHITHCMNRDCRFVVRCFFLWSWIDRRTVPSKYWDRWLHSAIWINSNVPRYAQLKGVDNLTVFKFLVHFLCRYIWSVPVWKACATALTGWLCGGDCLPTLWYCWRERYDVCAYDEFRYFIE